jgi:dolichol-phosphate mannosyltransferase
VFYVAAALLFIFYLTQEETVERDAAADTRAGAGDRAVGFAGIPVERDERFAGRSKYSFRKLLILAFDGIFSFTVVPLRAAAILGGIAILLTSLFAAYSLFARLFLDRSPRGFTALILALTFMAGVQLLFLGVIGEYVGRIFEEVKRRPLFVVDRLIGASEAEAPPGDQGTATRR